jgi:LysR family transcriptional regulator, glycine cleavage system transcriptional activator
MRQIPSISGLRAFESAGRHMSFQAAAEELHVTPGAVSRQIQGLEEFLGGRLFHRHHQRVDLTPFGRSYFEEIQSPLKQLAAASARARGDRHADTISICSYPTVAIRWLIPRWGSLYDRHPNIDIRLTTSLSPVDFKRGEYDMAIQIAPEGDKRKGLRVHKLLDVVTFPVCSPELAKKIRKPEDLNHHPLLHAAPRPRDWHHWLKDAEFSGIDADKGLHFEGSNLVINAAIEGLGIAIGIDALIQDELESGSLVALFDFRRLSPHPIQWVYPASKAQDPVVIAVRDWLLEEIEVSTGSKCT